MEDVRLAGCIAEERYPRVPSPWSEEVREAVERYPAVPRP